MLTLCHTNNNRKPVMKYFVSVLSHRPVQYVNTCHTSDNRKSVGEAFCVFFYTGQFDMFTLCNTNNNRKSVGEAFCECSFTQASLTRLLFAIPITTESLLVKHFVSVPQLKPSGLPNAG